MSARLKLLIERLAVKIALLVAGFEADVFTQNDRLYVFAHETGMAFVEGKAPARLGHWPVNVAVWGELSVMMDIVPSSKDGNVKQDRVHFKSIVRTSCSID